MAELTREELTILRVLASAEDRGLDLDLSAMQADAGSSPDVRAARLHRLADEGLIIIRLGRDQEGTDRIFVDRVLPAGRQRLDNDRRAGIVAERRQLRQAVLRALYDVTGGVPMLNGAVPEVLADRVGRELELVRTAVDALVDAGLADWTSMAAVGITRAGVDEIEQPDAPDAPLAEGSQGPPWSRSRGFRGRFEAADELQPPGWREHADDLLRAIGELTSFNDDGSPTLVDLDDAARLAGLFPIGARDLAIRMTAEGEVDYTFNDPTVRITNLGLEKLGSNLRPEPADADHEDGAPDRIWRPSRSGPLTSEDLAEASILLDTLGAWVAQLADDDPRLREADATQLILRSQIALEDLADRVHVRRAIENATALMGTEIREAVAEAVVNIDPEVAQPLVDAVDAVVTAAEEDDEEAWYPGMDQVDTALDHLLATIPPSNTPQGRKGRGKVIKGLALSSATGAAGGLAKVAAPGLTEQAWNLVVSILNMLM